MKKDDKKRKRRGEGLRVGEKKAGEAGTGALGGSLDRRGT